MDRILATSGYLAPTMAELRRHWEVIDIPSQKAALEYLRAVPDLPMAASIGYARPDVRAPGGDLDARTMIQEILKIDPALPVVISTGARDPKTIVDLVKLGAFDYVVEPQGVEREDDAVVAAYTQELVLALTRAVQFRTVLRDNEALRAGLLGGALAESTPSQSPHMRRVFDLVRKVAPTTATVLISGESGTGKEVIARAVHQLSRGREFPFTALNCGAFNEALLTSELFGHVKGAFTGADLNREGLIRQTGSGTLFLDEISAIPPGFQVLLLRVLEQRVARPVGSGKEYPVRCRFIAAANRDMEQLIRDGEFREDLWYRLNVVHIRLPPLRDRREDIPLLAQSFLRQFNAAHGKSIEGIDPGAMRMLEGHAWPGNIRELRNVLERAMIVAEGKRLATRDLEGQLRSIRKPALDAGHLPEYAPAMREYESRLIRAALARTRWRLTEAAALLGIKRTTLHYRIRRLGLDPRRQG